MKIYQYLMIEKYKSKDFSNCYMVVNERTRDSLLVDPGVFDAKIVETIETIRSPLRGVLVTHNHSQNCDGIETLLRIYPVPIFAADSELCDGVRILRNNGFFNIASFAIEFMTIPGHSIDSIVYKIGNVIFTGDVLLAGEIGSTTNYHSKVMLQRGVIRKILSKPGETMIMPGKGPPTTVAAEKQFNIDCGCPVVNAVSEAVQLFDYKFGSDE